MPDAERRYHADMVAGAGEQLNAEQVAISTAMHGLVVHLYTSAVSVGDAAEMMAALVGSGCAAARQLGHAEIAYVNAYNTALSERVHRGEDISAGETARRANEISDAYAAGDLATVAAVLYEGITGRAVPS